MGPAFFVIAILGCGEGDSSCEQVARAESRFESLASCTDATGPAVARHGDIPYPVVVAQCQPGNQAAVRLMAQDVKLPHPQPRDRQKYADNSAR
ncbi:hypothetical protein [Sphingosinicella rhizophila]|uniref:Lipoprotein n=1 Tax=Sphingosinicella rhizophila TaxID=3050082 RepID=A0ABU3Q873_9SPHN|nr:hypothetical protein [Sphingosinicella sp. GR2756]MDT9599615.1 hypothetical protein [Sphingosinicella sp. GR2756]